VRLLLYGNRRRWSFKMSMIIYCLSYHTLATLSSEIFILTHFFSLTHFLVHTSPQLPTLGGEAGDANAASPDPLAVRGEQPPSRVAA
jgi:hypothetical protein